MLVIDASATLHLLASVDGLEPLAGQDLVAPALLWSEATSVLSESRRRGEISEELANIAFGGLLSGPIARRASVDLYRHAAEVAKALGWAKTYDAEYVALARMLQTRLLTRDARLRRGAVRLVEAIGPDDL